MFSRHFWITAYAMLVLGCTIPGDDAAWARWSGLIPVCLGAILFFTCLKVPLGEVRAGFANQALMARAGWLSAVKLLALPLTAWAVARVAAPQWAAGVLLVCLMPAGMSSVALTDLYRGNRVLALFLLLVSSLLCPFTVPLALSAFDPSGAHIDALILAGRAGYIVLLLGVPFAAAQLVRVLAPALVARHHQRWSSVSIVFLCLLVFTSCVTQRGAWAHMHPADHLVPLALVMAASGMIVGVSLGLRRILPAGDATAFACGAIYMNNGLAVAFAARFYPGDAHVLLPCILMQIPMVAAVAWYGRTAKET